MILKRIFLIIMQIKLNSPKATLDYYFSNFKLADTDNNFTIRSNTKIYIFKIK